MELHELVARLTKYGLDEGEAVVYYHLCRTGGARAAEAAVAAGRKRPDTYRLLNGLVLRGFAEKTLERPTRFIPIPIATALERLIVARREEAEALALASTSLVDAWPKPHAQHEAGQQRFTVFQGREQVQGLIRRMFAAAQDEITVVASPGGLASLGLGAFFSTLEGAADQDVDIRVLTKPDSGPDRSLDALRGIASIRHAELPSYHQMIIVDAQQIALFISSGRKVSTKGDVQTVLWLNTPDFVLAQKALFDEVWSTAIASEERAVAAAEGRLPNQTRLLRGRWQRLDRLRRMIGHAQQSIWLRVPGAELQRWHRSGVARSLAKKAAQGVSVMVWSDASIDVPGVAMVHAPCPPMMECLVDERQALSVAGARDEPAALAFENEWGVWSTHRDTVDAVAQRFALLPDPLLTVD